MVHHFLIVYIQPLQFTVVSCLSGAIDNDQSVALMVAKVTPIGGKFLTEMSTNADNDHVSLYGHLARVKP